VKDDTALAILFTGVFALGVVLLAMTPGFAGDLNSLLLGSVMGIQAKEIWFIARRCRFFGGNSSFVF